MAPVARTKDEDVRTAPSRCEELVGLEYEGPFDDLPAQEGVEHRVIPWDDVALDEGTGIVHIAPGAGAEDFELSRVHDLPVLVPIDESGRMVAGYGPLEGFSTDEVEEVIIEDLRERELLVEVGRITHRYPICWRCKTPLVFRVVDDWFISADEIRQPMLDANATVEWTPSFYSKRMDDWLRNMGDWNISRKRYFGLPLPFYPCECGHLNVVGSKAELQERATAGLDQLQELHRPWIDEVPIRCEACGEEVRRIPEVGDAWLDAGIVPFSTLGWQNPEWVPDGYATGAAKGLTGADLPDHAYWEQWFPADWVSEMREQIRLWFYSMLFMSVTLEGRSPYERVLAYEKLLDETGREMHKSTGNAIEANEAIERMGADVMRWQYCAQPPSQNLNFGYGPAHEIKRRLLTLWNSVKFFVDYANIEGFRPTCGATATSEQPLDRWLLERTEQLVAEATDAYERYWTPDVISSFEAFVDDLSNWYIRRSRRRFWEGDATALERLCVWRSCRSLRVIAPVMPFLAEHLWRVLRPEDAPESIFLMPWPVAGERDDQLLAEVAETRRVVDLGRQARATLPAEAAPAAAPARRPGRGGRAVTGGRDPRGAAREGGRVRRGRGDRAARQAEPAAARPEARQGARRGAGCARRRESSRSSAAAGSGCSGHELGAGRGARRARGKEGWAVASDEGVTVALDTGGRRRARARGPRPRPDPRAELDAQGGRARAHRPDRGHPAGRPVRPARAARRLDQGRGACRLDRGKRRFRRARDREGLTTPLGTKLPDA